MQYYSSLDSLRAFAAIGVFIAHMQVFLWMKDLPNVWKYAPYLRMGNQMVEFFFVLSGFLITQVLLADGLPLTRAKLWGFYMRRVLRIWPVYYLTLFIGVALLYFAPDLGWSTPSLQRGEHVWEYVTGYLLFLPNYVYKFYPHLPFVAHTWSIGVEEHFYLLWPLVLSLGFRTGRIIVASLALFLVAKWGVKGTVDSSGLGWLWLWLVDQPFDSLAIGACFGYLHWNRNPTLSMFEKSRFVEVGAMFVFAGLTFWPSHYTMTVVVMLTLKVLYAVFVSVYAMNPRPLIPLDFAWLRYLGRISYGIYMYHLVAIGLGIAVTGLIVPATSVYIFPIVATILGAAFTFGMASLSWRYLERPILSLKGRFVRIPAAPGPVFAG